MRKLILTVLVVVALWSGVRLYTTANPPFGGKTVVHILAMGTDAGTPARTDTLIWLRVRVQPPYSCLAVWIPRDTKVTIPGHRGASKINAAHVFGGPSLTVKTVKETFSVPVAYYVITRAQDEVLAKVVDAVGGVPMYVPVRMRYRDNWQNLSIDLKPGWQVLDGKGTQGFVRWRGRTGDIGRIQRQQALLKSLANQCAQPKTITKLPQLAQIVTKECQTDIGYRDLIALFFALKHAHDAQAIRFARLPGYPRYERGVSFYFADKRWLAQAR
jgi:LCP family protein required for cell wall assembly